MFFLFFLPPSWKSFLESKISVKGHRLWPAVIQLAKNWQENEGHEGPLLFSKVFAKHQSNTHFISSFSKEGQIPLCLLIRQVDSPRKTTFLHVKVYVSLCLCMYIFVPQTKIYCFDVIPELQSSYIWKWPVDSLICKRWVLGTKDILATSNSTNFYLSYPLERRSFTW